MGSIKLVNDVDNAIFITHNGVFHADDVMAAAIIKSRYQSNEILMARVSDVKAEDILVGLCFDIGGGKFDHHQKGGNGVRENGIPYASAGLIWNKFGKMVVINFLEDKEIKMNGEIVDKIMNRVDSDLIQGIDAYDNGVFPQIDYPTQGMQISAAIKGFNPVYGERQDFDSAFLDAVDFAEAVLTNTLRNIASGIKAEEKVKHFIRKSIYDDILILNESLPWMNVVLNPSDDFKEKAEKFKYVIFPSIRGGWNWRAIPVSSVKGAPFRNPTPFSWCGLNGEDLIRECTVKDAMFVHPSGFIGGAETKEGCISMSRYMIDKRGKN